MNKTSPTHPECRHVWTSHGIRDAFVTGGYTRIIAVLQGSEKAGEDFVDGSTYPVTRSRSEQSSCNCLMNVAMPASALFVDECYARLRTRLRASGRRNTALTSTLVVRRFLTEVEMVPEPHRRLEVRVEKARSRGG